MKNTFEQEWEHFWKVARKNKDVHELGRTTRLYYIVKEFFGYSPRQRLTEEEKSYIKSFKRGSEQYEKLYKTYQKRVEGYLAK